MTLNTEWMSKKHGLMVHYLPPMLETCDGKRPDRPDGITEQFDLNRFLTDFDATGADYLIFTFGQNTGFYNAPNPVIDRYAGPGHCSGRDLVGELAAALATRGKSLIGYLPCELHSNPALHRGFAWNTAPGTDQAEFQSRWLEAVRFWSERYAKQLAGWWFDGCYTWDAFPSSRMRWDEWFAAARAGNPGAAVTFNNGCFCIDRITPPCDRVDYLSGEATVLQNGLPRPNRSVETYRPQGKFLPGTAILQHLLIPVDALWWHNAPLDWLSGVVAHPFRDPATLKPGEMEPPLYSLRELQTARDAFCSVGGAVTFNAGIYLNGSLGKRTVELLARLRKYDTSAATQECSG